jgi:hypothetical protein
MPNREALAPDSAAQRDEQSPTWSWTLDLGLLREAAEIRRRDPREFRGAVLTCFGFGGRDDGTIIATAERIASARS